MRRDKATQIAAWTIAISIMLRFSEDDDSYLEVHAKDRRERRADNAASTAKRLMSAALVFTNEGPQERTAPWRRADRSSAESVLASRSYQLAQSPVTHNKSAPVRKIGPPGREED